MRYSYSQYLLERDIRFVSLENASNRQSIVAFSDKPLTECVAETYFVCKRSLSAIHHYQDDGFSLDVHPEYRAANVLLCCSTVEMTYEKLGRCNKCNAQRELRRRVIGEEEVARAYAMPRVKYQRDTY